MESLLELTGIMIAICMPIFIVVFIKRYLAHKTRLAELEAARTGQLSEQDLEALQQLVGRLSERVQVLEAIVTDQGYEVKEQINRL